jgi:hypothetical protein
MMKFRLIDVLGEELERKLREQVMSLPRVERLWFATRILRFGFAFNRVARVCDELAAVFVLDSAVPSPAPANERDPKDWTPEEWNRATWRDLHRPTMNYVVELVRGIDARVWVLLQSVIAKNDYYDGNPPPNMATGPRKVTFN